MSCTLGLLARLGLALGSLSLAVLPAAAQTPTAAAPEPAPGAPAAAFAIPEVATRVEETLARLREIDARGVPRESLSVIEAALDETIARFPAGTASLQQLLGGQPTLEALIDAERPFATDATALAAWRSSLTDAASQLEGDLDELEQLMARWESTRGEARKRRAPRALLDRVRQTLAAVSETTERVRAHRAAVLTLQDRVAEQERAASEALAAIAQAREAMRSQLFAADSAALWTALRPESAKDVSEAVRGTAFRYRATVLDFLRLRSDRFAAHALLFVGVLGLLLALRRRAIEFAAEDTAFAATAHIFRRPFSAAALVALLAVYWLYAPGVPRSLVTLVGLAALLPSLRLLPGLLGEASRSTVWGLALLYLLDRLDDLFTGIPLLSRLLLLVVTGAALLLGAWLLRSGRIAELRPDPRWLRAFTLGCRTGIAMLGIALGANLFGFVDLAGLLTNGVLVTAYGGVVTYAVARTVDGVVAVALHTRRLQRLQTVRRHAPLLTRRARGVIRLLALAVWGVIVLTTFRLRDAVWTGAGVLFGTRVTLGELAISLGDVVGFAAAISAAWLLSRFVRFVLDEEVYPRALLRRGVPQAISTTLHYVILLAGFALALGAAGVNLDRFTVLVGAFGVGVGFGLQNVINNFVSGLILLFERPVQVGDTVELGTLLGEVKRIGIRSSSVRTWEGADVIVPNAMLVSDRVVNWTYADRQRRIDLPVGVAYGSKPQQVAELLGRVARQHPRVLQDPEPVALFMGFGESSLDFQLRVWTADFERFPQTRSELALAVHDALEQASVEIPFPQRDLHVRSAEPAARAALLGPPGGPR